jgi:hypothetical protein
MFYLKWSLCIKQKILFGEVFGLSVYKESMTLLQTTLECIILRTDFASMCYKEKSC